MSVEFGASVTIRHSSRSQHLSVPVYKFSAELSSEENGVVQLNLIYRGILVAPIPGSTVSIRGRAMEGTGGAALDVHVYAGSFTTPLHGYLEPTRITICGRVHKLFHPGFEDCATIRCKGVKGDWFFGLVRLR